MIIWSGFGFLVPVIGIGSLVLTQYLTELITQNEQFYKENDWVNILAMVLAAALTLGLHKLLNPPNPKRLIDADTGEEFVLRRSHSFFFIPVKWWTFIFLVFGTIVMFTENNS